MSSPERFVFNIAVSAAVGGFLFGFDTAVISGALPYLTQEFGLDSGAVGWAVGAVLIGCSLGALLAGIAAELWGRKPVLLVCAALFAVSGIGVAIAGNLFVFVIFRMVGGLGVGAAAMVAPMYIAETAPAESRGKLVSLYQLAIVTGILCSYLTNYGIEKLTPGNWRVMFGLQLLPSVLWLIILNAVPESPRWLVMHGRTDMAYQVLSRIHDSPGAVAAISSIKRSLLQIHQQAGNKLNRVFVRLCLLGCLMAIFQQVTGINAILYYAPLIFKETGIDGNTSLMQTVGIGVVNVAATFIAIRLVDRYGRKQFLVCGSLLMGACLAVTAVCFHYHYFRGYLVLICTLVYVAGFGCTLGAVTWVCLSELFPNQIRSIAISISTLALWLADFLVSYTFPVLQEKLGIEGTLFCYAGCCALALLFYATCIPETKGKSLEAIESMFLK